MSVQDEIRSPHEIAMEREEAIFRQQMHQSVAPPASGLIAATKPESVKALEQCIDLQLRKANDYQNPASSVSQADYYPRGCATIHDIVHAKMLRMKSLLETMESDSSAKPNYESLEDSAMDAINYLSFMVSWCRKKIPGQSEFADPLNRIKS